MVQSGFGFDAARETGWLGALFQGEFRNSRNIESKKEHKAKEVWKIRNKDKKETHK